MSLLVKKSTRFPSILSTYLCPSAPVSVHCSNLATLAMAGRLASCPQALTKTSVSNFDQAHSETGYGQHVSPSDCLSVRSRTRFVAESSLATVGVPLRSIFASEQRRSNDSSLSSLCRSHATTSSHLRRDFRVFCNASVAEPAQRRTVDKVIDTQRLRPSDIEEEASLDERAENGGAQSREWAALGLSPALIARLRAVGLASATDVQMAAIPTLLNGHDAALQSYTGSGKTLAFLLPILSRIGPLASPRADEQGGASASKGTYKGVQALIVAPSRELAMQIVREAEKILGPDMKRSVQQLIGGANPKRQEEALKFHKPAIVVGTPGRISDVSRTGRLQTHSCEMLILDEADSLMSQKFRMDMLRILEHVGTRRGSGRPNSDTKRTERQTVLVSATMPAGVLEAATKWGNKPLHVRAGAVTEVALPGGGGKGGAGGGAGEGGRGREAEAIARAGIRESLPPNLDHRVVVVQQRHKVDVLRKCIHALDAQSVIVFMNYGKRLKDTEFKLGARSIQAGNLHGGLDKVERANVLSAFKDGKLRVLVVSEVGARGLDVLECDLVVNLELPTDASHYAHRAGRTGRLGRGGTVITICEEPEAFVLEKFGRHLGIDVPRAEVVEGRLVEYSGRMKY